MNDKKIKIIADDCVVIKRLINEKLEELKNLKTVLKEKMEEKEIRRIRGDSYEIRRQVYKAGFTSTLSKNIFTLDAEIINDLIQSELIKKAVSYKLDTMKYQEINDSNEDTPIDPFVTKRKERSSLVIFADLRGVIG